MKKTSFLATIQDMLGFKIVKPLELLNWTPLALRADITLDHQEICPACTAKLRVLALLYTENAHNSIRIGACERCGYLGYEDRPAAEWISRYYAREWSHHARTNSGRLKPQNAPNTSARQAVDQALAKIRERERVVLEIGSGYGSMLEHVKNRGFPHVIGIESSLRRAELAEARSGIEVLRGEFGSPELETRLNARSPLSLIFSFHVLEHTYHPEKILAAIARLQRNGDYLILGVPNIWGEPTMSILLFLPHLHSFSREALINLIHRAGYRVVDETLSTDRELLITAIKDSGTSSAPLIAPRAWEKLSRKFSRELGLAQILTPGKSYRYMWSKKDTNDTAIKPYHWFWRLGERLHKHRDYRSLEITGLSSSPCTQETPVCLAFSGDITLAKK